MSVRTIARGDGVKKVSESKPIRDTEFRPRKTSAVKSFGWYRRQDVAQLPETDNAGDDKLSNPLKFADKPGDASLREERETERPARSLSIDIAAVAAVNRGGNR